MATVTTYNLTITQTRPDTDTRWYDRQSNDEWNRSWKAFNFYDVEAIYGEINRLINYYSHKIHIFLNISIHFSR